MPIRVTKKAVIGPKTLPGWSWTPINPEGWGSHWHSGDVAENARRVQ
jgi:hypothetical protein